MERRIKKLFISSIVLIVVISAVLTLPILRGTFAKSKYNVIYIVIDALRADHLSNNGYHPAYFETISPNIDNLAREGINFKKGFCHASWTLPSHFTMFTSLYPSVHGMTEPGILPEEFTLMAEVFKKKHYKTGGFVSGGYVKSKFGFDRGFDIYVDRMDEAPSLTKQALQWLNENPEEKFFIFMHCHEPHVPYDPPAEYRISDDYTWEQMWVGSVLFNQKYSQEERAVLYGQDDFRKKVIELYDAEINYVDEILGRFFEKLKEENLYDNTLIVLTSDHGEEFMDHGGWSHGWLYDESIHIPFILKLPGKYRKYNGQVINTQVGHIDMMPTVIDFANLPLGDLLIQGKTLMPLIKGKTSEDKNIFVEKHEKIGLRTPDRKFIIDQKGEITYELYDLKKDPKERKNLLLNPTDEILETKKKMEEVLAQFTRTNHYFSMRYQVKNREVFDPEELKKFKELENDLKSLGYIK
jgi:arylsulfatase A-like enzyme